MKITQEQFNELVYWSTQALYTETNGSLEQRYATSQMMHDYCNAILKGSLKVSIESYSHRLTIFPTKDSGWIDIRPGTENRQEIVNAFNKLLNIDYKYTLDETTRPNLLMSFLTVHGTTVGAGLAVLLLSSVLAPSLAPVGLAALVGAALALFPRLMPLPKHSDGLGEAILYLYGVGMIGLMTVITLINTPCLLLGVLGGAVAGAVLGETAVDCGMTFFNLPKQAPVHLAENIINAASTVSV